jgi:AcrR family transcriptional regulator
MARPKTITNRAELIIEASEELFGRYGYERTSIEDIAKYLNIGKGSVYLDFRTKQEILLEILRRHAIAMQDIFEERLNNISGSPLQALYNATEESVMTCYDIVSRDFHTPEALLHTSLEMKAHFKDFYIRKNDLITGFLNKAAEAGEVKKEIANEDTAKIFMMVTATIFPPYLNCTEFNSPITRQLLQAQTSKLLSLLVSGLRLYRG